MKKILGFALAALLGFGLAGGLFLLNSAVDANNSSGGSQSGTNVEIPEEIIDPIFEWKLCEDYSELAVGDKIVLVASEYDVALGNVQNDSNRSAGMVLKDGDMVAIGSSVQVITLEHGLLEDTFAFWVETGYLYAPSSASNHLKTRTTLDEKGSWKFTDADYLGLQIVSQGASTRNCLRYNQKSNLFSCYESATIQYGVLIYKYVGVEVAGGEAGA